MKKLATICLLVFGFLFTTQSVNAQQKFDAKVNQAAQTKAVEFGRYLKTDQATQELIYTIYQEYLDKTNTLNNSFKKGSSDYTALESKITKRLMTQMNNALTEPQFAKFLELTDLKDLVAE